MVLYRVLANRLRLAILPVPGTKQYTVPGTKLIKVYRAGCTRVPHAVPVRAVPGPVPGTLATGFVHGYGTRAQAGRGEVGWSLL